MASSVLSSASRTLAAAVVLTALAADHAVGQRPDPTHRLAGRFAIENVPGGTGTLRFWHERGEAGSTRIGIPSSAEVALRIEITQPRVPPHRNKFGRSYTRGAYGG